jgi:hypothetical protein
MSKRTVQIKLVAIADTQLKMGEEINAAITIPEHGFLTTEIAKNLVLMVSALMVDDPNKPTGMAAATAMGLITDEQ